MQPTRGEEQRSLTRAGHGQRGPAPGPLLPMASAAVAASQAGRLTRYRYVLRGSNELAASDRREMTLEFCMIPMIRSCRVAEAGRRWHRCPSGHVRRRGAGWASQPHTAWCSCADEPAPTTARAGSWTLEVQVAVCRCSWTRPALRETPSQQQGGDPMRSWSGPRWSLAGAKPRPDPTPVTPLPTADAPRARRHLSFLHSRNS